MMTKRRVLFCCILLFAGCGLSNVKPEMPVSYQQKAFFLLKAYNAEFAKYKVAVVGELTDEDKTVLRRKREILKELHPLIGKYYRSTIALGHPTPELMSKIKPLLKELTDG